MGLLLVQVGCLQQRSEAELVAMLPNMGAPDIHDRVGNRAVVGSQVVGRDNNSGVGNLKVEGSCE